MAACCAAEIPAVGGWLRPSHQLGTLFPLLSSVRGSMLRGAHSRNLRLLTARLLDSPHPAAAPHTLCLHSCLLHPPERQSLVRHFGGWDSGFSPRHRCQEGIDLSKSSWHRSFTTQVRKGKRVQKQMDIAGQSDGASVREAALQAAISKIEQEYGKETVMWMGRNNPRQDIAVISTGSLSLDIALGIGGLPKGRVIEIYGPEASGKTTLALHVVAEAQKLGGKCLFVDAEHALDRSFAEKIGVDINDLLLSQPDNGEQALNITDLMIRSGSIDVVVVDSVAALVPKAELEGEMGDTHMALQARLMSQALRKLTSSLSRAQTTLIFINQIRSKLGTFGGFGGPLEVTSGGNALKFYASVRLNIRRTNMLKTGNEVTGNQVVVKVTKNKLAPPFRTAEFEIEFGRGISRESEVLELGVKHGLLSKSGSWFAYNKENFANGRDQGKQYLRENPDFCDKLIALIKEASLDVGRGSTSDADAIEDMDDEDVDPEDFDAKEA